MDIKKSDLTYYVMMVIALLVYIYNKICDSQDAKRVQEHFRCCSENLDSVELLNKRIDSITKKMNGIESPGMKNDAMELKRSLITKINKSYPIMNKLGNDILEFKLVFDEYHPYEKIQKREEAKAHKEMKENPIKM